MRNVSTADLALQQQVRSTPIDSGKRTADNNAKTSEINKKTDVAAINQTNNQTQIPSVHERNQNKMVLEQEMDKLLKAIMPDLGIKFRVHDSGHVITTVTNNETKEVVREFPAEKILDIVYSMVQRLGIGANGK